MRLLLVLPLTLSLAACTSTRGPEPGSATSPPVPVRELELVMPADSQLPIVLQFRERNTLVIDLTSVAASGGVGLRPGASGRWPVRLALRFQPGRFEAVEARGAQRLLMPVTTNRTGTATVELSPTVYPAAGQPLLLRWGANREF